MSGPEPKILYENDDVLIIDKPAGLLVHGIYDKSGPKHREMTVVDWAIRRVPEIAKVGDDPVRRPGVVHRLDRETSGVLVIAKNNPAFVFLKREFQDQKAEKIYTALVWGAVKGESGRIEKPISIKDGSVKRTVFKGKMTRAAITEYRVLERFESAAGPLTLLEVRPKTGRTHQIRVHLSSLGHQVVGDKLYGKKGSLPNLPRHFLHAGSLTLTLPGGKKFTATAPLPQELDAAIRALRDPRR